MLPSYDQTLKPRLNFLTLLLQLSEQGDVSCFPLAWDGMVVDGAGVQQLPDGLLHLLPAGLHLLDLLLSCSSEGDG